MEIKKGKPPKIDPPHWWKYVEKLQEIRDLFPDEWVNGSNPKIVLSLDRAERLREILRTIQSSCQEVTK